MIRDFLFINQVLLFATLLFAAIAILLLIKYLSVKKTVRDIIKEINNTHENEISQFKQQFYVQLNQDFKHPFGVLLQGLEKLYTEESDPEKKKEIFTLLQKVKVTNHKLNQWPDKGKVKKDELILNRLKKEIYQHAEGKYPSTTEIPSVKTVLENSQEQEHTDLVKEYLEKNFSPEIFNKRLNGADEELLKNIINYLHSNLENPELSVEGISKEMGLSRNHLHRKLKALTGQSPVEFIKTLRMSYAAHLLSIGKWSVSEVGYKVGYNTPSYFSSSFNTHYGMSPTAYMERAQNRGNKKATSVEVEPKGIE